jgi:transposase IS116/IS110/IS902 family protein
VSGQLLLYPETARLRQVSGVGAITALQFVLTIGDAHHFPQSRIPFGFRKFGLTYPPKHAKLL